MREHDAADDTKDANANCRHEKHDTPIDSGQLFSGGPKKTTYVFNWTSTTMSLPSSVPALPFCQVQHSAKPFSRNPRITRPLRQGVAFNFPNRCLGISSHDASGGTARAEPTPPWAQFRASIRRRHTYWPQPLLDRCGLCPVSY